jgi:hypothetical protein
LTEAEELAGWIEAMRAFIEDCDFYLEMFT